MSNCIHLFIIFKAKFVKIIENVFLPCVKIVLNCVYHEKPNNIIIFCNTHIFTFFNLMYFFRIICSVNTVFYRHLCNWIIFGNLVDVHQEFFIFDAKCPDEDFLWTGLPSEKKSDLVSLNESLVNQIYYCFFMTVKLFLILERYSN